MKRAVSFVLMFLFIILVYQLIVVYFSNGHEVTYELATAEKAFTINEVYKKDYDVDGYYLKITSNDNREYVFYTNNVFNKQKKIISEVKYYEKDDYLCIYPIDIKSKNDFEILCNNGKNLYSYYYVNNKTDISAFVDELKLTKHYNQNDETKLEEQNIIFYKNNFYDNEYLELYNYKSLYIFNKGELSNVDFSTTDIYKNTLGAYIDNYFLVPKMDSKEITSYYIINCKTKETRMITFDQPLSTNSYVVGVVNDKLYLFDLTNKKEYEIDPEGTYLEIGNVASGFSIFADGKWVDTSITEFTNNKITIKNKTNIKLDYKYDELYETDTAYYINDKNMIYKIYKNNLDTRILLLELKNYNNLKIENNRIYYINNQYLYRYDQYGVKKLVNNNEFKYNNTNIYHVYND